MTGRPEAPAHRIPKRYITSVLFMAAAGGAVLLLLGYPALAKGLILGTLFSALNFFLMAIFLPMRLGQSRSRSIFISLASICFRFALLAVPLILAAKNAQFAIASTVIGLFAVPATIIIDQLLSQQRNSARI